MMTTKQITAWAFLSIILTNSLTSALVQPSPPMARVKQIEESPPVVSTSDWQPVVHSPRLIMPRSYPTNIVQRRADEESRPVYRDVRKFAEKPNHIKKVAIDDIDADMDSNEIGQGMGNGFSWSGILGMVMQMIFNGAGIQGPTKSDGLDSESSVSPWTNLLSVGLKIISALFGIANPQGDNIDKIDSDASPMQSILATVLSAVLGTRDPDQVATMAKQAGEFISIVVNLLDTLKTSFSHRSMMARNLGKKDSMSDAAVASITLLKGYMRTLGTSEDQCMQMYLCEANRECMHDVGPSSVFCQFGTYAAGYILEKSANTTFNNIYEAGRRGRSGTNCRQSYHECNEV